MPLQNEERKRREEQREEERRKKDEEKRMKEEAELKKSRKHAEHFAKFFERKTDSAKKEAIAENDDEVMNFKKFQVKQGMKLAPIIRRKLLAGDKKALERQLTSTAPAAAVNNLYLAELKTGQREVGRSGKTLLPVDDEPQEGGSDDDDVQMLGKSLLFIFVLMQIDVK